MLCPRCYGKHFVIDGTLVPCPECSGLGELHCCDGLQVQSELPVNRFATENTEDTEKRAKKKKN